MAPDSGWTSDPSRSRSSRKPRRSRSSRKREASPLGIAIPSEADDPDAVGPIEANARSVANGPNAKDVATAKDAASEPNAKGEVSVPSAKDETAKDETKRRIAKVAVNGPNARTGMTIDLAAEIATKKVTANANRGAADAVAGAVPAKK